MRAALDSPEYLQLERLEVLLRRKQWEQLADTSQIVDKAALLRGIKSGKVVEKLMQEFETIPVDVISLAQAREAVQAALDEQY